MGLNRLKSVVRDSFATRVTMALSGILKFGGRNKKERIGTVLELNALRILGKSFLIGVAGFEHSLGV